MKAIIICNGTAPGKALLNRYMQGDAFIICCDGGAEIAMRYGIHIDVLVGDFDSLGKARAEEIARMTGCEFIALPVMKDQTDSEYAIDIAAQKHARDIVILAGTGSRLDHTLGNVQLLIKCRKMGMDCVLVDENNEARVTCTTLALPGKIGDLLSLIPLSVNARIRCTGGLLYPLFDTNLEMGTTLGVSNVYVNDVAVVEVEHGWVLVVKSTD